MARAGIMVFMIRPATIAFLGGLLPIVAVLGAYLINVIAGTGIESRFVCVPYLDGCVSISRAARSGPGLILFKAVMLPCAVLLLLSWHGVRCWLNRLGACSRRRSKTIFWLGATGAVFLVFYVTWLGTEGEWYHWLRRYGVTFYFGGTALAQLILVSVLLPARNRLAAGNVGRPIIALSGLVALQWLLGVFSIAKHALFDNPAVIDRVENLVEWWFALPMALAFVVIALMFRRTGFGSGSRVENSVN